MTEKKQYRRSISLSPLTYQRLRKYCDEEVRSMAGFIEELINERLDDEEFPRETVVRTQSYPIRKGY